MTAHLKDLNGKVAVITGGASGIGLAFAKRFGAAGAKLMLADIEQGALDRAVADLKASGITVEGMLCDVASADAVEALAVRTYDAFGAAHVLCNNAGVVTFKPPWEQTLADWKWVIDIDLYGVVHGIASFLPRMVAGGEAGHIVNTASVAGLLGFQGIAPYVAAKHAVVGLSESIHNDLRAAGKPIGVSVLCPGGVRTGIYRSERNRPGVADVAPVRADGGESNETISPEEVAELVHASITSGTFWILPHERYVAMYKAVTESAAARTDPPVPSVDR